MKIPDVVQKLSDDGTIMIGGTPEQLRKYVAEESARWRKVADTGIQLGD